MQDVRPYTIDIPQTDLDDLRRRLEATRWAPDLPGTGWSRGVPTAYLRELVDHWTGAYDWRRQEAALNRLPQFTTEIDGATVHFAHRRAHGRRAPLPGNGRLPRRPPRLPRLSDPAFQAGACRARLSRKSHGFQDEDGDHAVGHLLVLGVRRIRGDRALPPLGLLLLRDLPGHHVPAH